MGKKYNYGMCQEVIFNTFQVHNAHSITRSGIFKMALWSYVWFLAGARFEKKVNRWGGFRKWRSKKYREFIGLEPCLRCGRYSFIRDDGQGQCDPHHEKWGSDSGMSTKASDIYLVPLCRTCHDKYVTMTPAEFWVTVSVRDAQLRFLNEYLTSTGVWQCQNSFRQKTMPKVRPRTLRALLVKVRNYRTTSPQVNRSLTLVVEHTGRNPKRVWSRNPMLIRGDS